MSPLTLARDLRQLPENMGPLRTKGQCDRGPPMGDCQNGDLRASFDGRMKLTFLGSQVTTGGNVGLTIRGRSTMMLANGHDVGVY